jgi:hypothetical protein
LAQAGLKKKSAELEQALRGMVGLHQRLMLRHLLNHVDFLARQIGLLDGDCSPPPAQIPASGTTALGSYLG